jgi:glycosyltransferase involved in cell wall biosynthesis
MGSEPGRTSTVARVLYVINDLQRAGAETQLVRLAGALPRNRWEPRIVLLKERNDFADELRAVGIPVTALHRRGAADIGVWRRLRDHIAAQAPDIVHSFLFLPSVLAVPAARDAGVPVVVVSQRCSYDATVGQPWRAIARRVHGYADRVIVNSRAALREEEAAGLPPERLLYIPNGITAGADLPADREALGLATGPLAVCVAQLAVEKGHRDLIAAWAGVRQHVPAATLALVGDGPLRPALEAAARDAGLTDSIRFLGHRPDARRLLAGADVAVLASITEGMPNALLEAMAAGRAVVATRVGGIPDVVVDGETGRLVPPRQPIALAKALAEVLTDAAQRARFGEAGRARVERQFSMPTVARAFAETYETLLEARRPRVRLVVGQFWPEIGGSENQCRRLASALARRGLNVEVWTRRLEAAHARVQRVDGVIVHRLGPAARGFRLRRVERYAFMAALFARAWRLRHRFDVLHVHQVLYPAVVAATAARVAGRACLARVAGSGESSDFRWLTAGTGLRGALARRFLTRVVAVDPVTRDECLAVGFRAEQVAVIPNGVAVPERTADAGREPPQFLWTGVLRPEKRVDLLLRAWVAASEPGELRIVGEGSERARLEAQIRSKGLARVRMTGAVAEAAEEASTAQVFVLPSDAEGMSNALLEGMAAGLACVATAVGGNVHLLGGSPGTIAAGTFVRAEAGLLVPAGDEAGLAAALRALASSPSLRLELGAAARDRCLRHFSIESVADRYCALYRELRP